MIYLMIVSPLLQSRNGKELNRERLLDGFYAERVCHTHVGSHEHEISIKRLLCYSILLFYCQICDLERSHLVLFGKGGKREINHLE